jgi:hypothetical protein
MARPGIVTAVTTAYGGAAVGPIEDHGAAIQARTGRCQDRAQAGFSLASSSLGLAGRRDRRSAAGNLQFY